MQNQLKQTRAQAWLLMASAIMAVTGTLVGSLTGGPLLYISAAFWLIMSVTRIVQRGKPISIPYESIKVGFFDITFPNALARPKNGSIWRSIQYERERFKRADEIEKEEERKRYNDYGIQLPLPTTVPVPSWIRAFVKVLFWRFLCFSIGFGRFCVSWPFREIWQQIKFLRQNSP